MIVPQTRQDPRDAAAHHDGLDHVYRMLWGEHLHHGLFTRGDEAVAVATRALSLRVGERLSLRGGEALIDIGCGYGATAALFAERHDARVTGFTLSAAQAAVARARNDPRLTIEVADWLEAMPPAGGFDGAYAIESSEHMADKAGFFAQAARVLRPGGRLVICAWLAADRPGAWAVRHLLEPICREGRLPGLGTRGDYFAWGLRAGLHEVAFEDASARVARTWTIRARRFAHAMATDAEMRRIVREGPDRGFALSLPRLMLAYRTGAMRYGIFTFAKPEAAA